MLTDAAIAALTASGNGAFAFFPPVRGFQENRWKFGEATRIEFSATNFGTGAQVWFARSAVAYMTVEESALTLALKRELKYENGSVWPVRPSAGPAEEPEAEGAVEEAEAPSAGPPRRPQAPPLAAASTRPRRSWWSEEPLTLVLATAGSAALALVLVMIAAHAWLQPPQRTDSAPIDDPNLYTLTREDNYHDVVRKLGRPDSERPLSLAGSDITQRALFYRSHNYAVVLMGIEGQRNYAQEPCYIGAIRLSDGAVVASVSLAHDSTTDSLLKIFARQLKE
jgi:hypothetical protein